MNVNEWGPGGWIFLHTTTFNYPLNPEESDKVKYTNFFNSIKTILPCKYCRQSFEVYMKYIPLEEFLESREAITYWLYRLHNLVNEKVFKKKYSFDHVVRRYEKIRAGCSKLIRDGDVNKKFGSCQSKTDTKMDEISIFVRNAEIKYKNKIDKLIETLYMSEDNPNKEYLDYLKTNEKYNINYSI
jgi:hypothetical protein